MLTIKVDNNYSFIYGEIPKDIFYHIDQQCSYYIAGFSFSPQYNHLMYSCNSCNLPKFELQSNLLICPKCGSSNLSERRAWDGKKHLCSQKGDCISFPTGLFSIVREVLKLYKIEYKIIDLRSSYPLSNSYSIRSDFILRDYQKFSIDKACECQRGIIQVGTGGGKTCLGAGIICSLGVTPVIWYVLSKDLLLQAKEEFEDLIRQNGSPAKIGVIGAGYCDIKDINVMTIQTAMRALDKKFTKSEMDEYNEDKTDIKNNKQDVINLIRESKSIYIDEAHHIPAQTVKDVILESSKAKFRFGLSASPWRDSGDDLCIEANIGRKIVKITSSDLIKEDYLVKPTIYFKNIKSKVSNFRSYTNIYDDAIIENDKRNEFIAEKANEMASQNRPVLILVRYIKHGKKILSYLPNAVMITGKDKLKRRKEVIEKMKSKEQLITIASSLADEGLNICSLECGIFAGSGKSSTRALQRVGRFLRKYGDKKEAVIYDFSDKSKYLEEHTAKRRKIYETEPEFKIIDI